MKPLYIALLTLVTWLFSLMAVVMLGMALFGKPALFPAAFILTVPAAGAWYLRWKAKKGNDVIISRGDLGSVSMGGTTVDFSFEQSYQPRKLKNNKPEKNIQCPHCTVLFDEMPKRKRRCPHCKEWIWPMRPPGMKHKRLTTVEQAQTWKLESAKIEGGFPYALELARQGKPFFEAAKAAQREHLLEWQEEGVQSVSISPDGDECHSCSKLNRSHVSIADELLDQRLPCPDCTAPLHRYKHVTGWCTCGYEI